MCNTKKPGKRIINSEKEKCSLCKVCSFVCPKNAIDFIYDEHDFEYYASINGDKCIDCGKCTSVCPINTVNVESNYKYNVYAAYAEDNIRLASSSGGLFSLFARCFIDQGGKVVGASLIDGTKVKHCLIEKREDITLLAGSKYFRSELDEVLKDIEQNLINGKKILFVGTPCQVSAVKNTFAKYENLIYSIDLLCKGVPKEKIVQDYIDTFDKNIEYIKFRDKKRFGWSGSNAVFHFSDASEYVSEYWNDDIFQRLYHDCLSLRESCLSCKLAEFPRKGDISLGDMWDLDKIDVQIANDNKGISKVFVNSEKGKWLFDQIKGGLVECVEISIKDSFINRLKKNLQYDAVMRSHFYDLMRKGYDMKKCFNHAVKKQYDVGLIGCYSIENHGSNMTYYALYKYLTDLGLDVLMIERPNSAEWKGHHEPSGFIKNPYKEYSLAPIYEDKQEMKELNEFCDVFLLGSDQLLYHDLYKQFDEYIDMRYIRADKKKIAYSTSLGRLKFEGDKKQKATLSHFLQKFDAISIREQSTIGVLNKEFGIQADWMPDPVFLLTKEQYVQFLEEQQDGCLLSSDKKYIGAYILDPSAEKEAILNTVALRERLKLKIFSDVAYQKEDVENENLDYDISSTNEEWLQGILDCQLFITDSFHGTCFAIIFNKPFVCIANKRRGYERFSSLLEHFDLMDCLIDNLSNLSNKQFGCIDFERVNKIIEEDRKLAENWLKEKLRPINRSLSDYDVLDDRIDDVNSYITKISSVAEENRNRSIASESWLANTHESVNMLKEMNTQLRNEIDMINARYNSLQKELESINNRFINRLCRKFKSLLFKR